MIPWTKTFPMFYRFHQETYLRKKIVQNPTPSHLLTEKKITFPTDVFLCHCLRMLVTWVTQGEVKPCLLLTSPKTQITNFLLYFFMLLSIHILIKLTGSSSLHHGWIYWLHNIPSSWVFWQTPGIFSVWLHHHQQMLHLKHFFYSGIRPSAICRGHSCSSSFVC